MKYLISLAILIFSLAPAGAQDSPHDKVRTGLLHLHATGTPGQPGHPLEGEDGGVEAQGTGFFVGNDGFILTTRHFLEPLEKAQARRVQITASIGGADSRKIPLLVASELPRVDLLLLKAILPFDMERPRPLRIGRSSSFDRAEPTELYTSGFRDTRYIRKEADFNASESPDFPYAWTLDVTTDSGQSGSPVYDRHGTVLGVIKATVRGSNDLTLMIPIEFAMPLIGHLEIDRLNNQVAFLRAIIGELTQDDPPLHDRLVEIETGMNELSNRFTWSAATAPDGTVRVRYEKLIGGGAQVDGIYVNVAPYMRMRGRDGISSRKHAPLRLGEGTEYFFEREDLDEGERVGEFVIPNVHSKLELLAQVLGEVTLDDPVSTLEVTILPVVDGETIDRRKLSVVPEYNWGLTQ